MNSFAIVTQAPDGQIMVVEAAAFTENQRAAIHHMLSRIGQALPAPLEMVQDLPPVTEPSPTPVPSPAPVTGDFPLASSAAQERQRAMDANREAAKVQAAERVQQARGMGYTGDLCTQCGSDRMKRNGSCLCCEGCGATTGCS